MGVGRLVSTKNWYKLVIFRVQLLIYHSLWAIQLLGVAPGIRNPGVPQGIASARFKVKEISADLSNTMEAERQVLLTQEICWAHLKVLKKTGFKLCFTWFLPWYICKTWCVYIYIYMCVYQVGVLHGLPIYFHGKCIIQPSLPLLNYA